MQIQQPIKRSPLRKLLGREYYILRRKWLWLFGSTSWAKTRSTPQLSHQVFSHKSLILRELKNVDMYLQENKRTNLDLAIQQLNGILIQPGETFSLWKLVGRPTASKGYLEGLVLEQGNISKGIGGGLCQLGNLLFWMCAHSPLTITERYRHGFDVFPDVNRKVPFGAGATLSYNHIDFQFKNNTDAVFHLNLWLDDTHLHGVFTSNKPLISRYSIEERNHVIKQQIWGGYSRHNQIFKLTTQENGETHEALLVQNSAIMMYEPLLAS